MTGKRIGYIRVSTPDQNPDRQLENIPLDKRFIEYASAKSTNRPMLNSMLDFVREDDIVIVHSMDRLARNLKDLKNLVDMLVSNKIQVHFLKENLIFTGENSATSNLVLHLMGAFAEFEHAFILERQREGIAIAKRFNKYKGREKCLTKEQIEVLRAELQTNKTKCKIAVEMGICRASLYKYIKEYKLFEKKD